MDTLRANTASLAPHNKKHKVSIIGSGNWGSTISKIIAENTKAHPDLFEPQVRMWVYEETLNMSEMHKRPKCYDASAEICVSPQPLTKLINHFHENVKYLPNIALPQNVFATPDLTEAVEDATILIFNLPHQFIERICGQLKDHILPYARGISCIKGVDVKGSHISLFSESIGDQLGIYCGALSGANIANEVAEEKWCETTIAYHPPPVDSQAPTPVGGSPTSSQVDLSQVVHRDASGKKSKVKLRPFPAEYQPLDQSTIKALFHRPYFHVRVVSDVAGVSLSGALKNIVAIAAGWVDGLGWGDNAKAAIMRVGLLEMVEFGKRFYGSTINVATFTEESAGVADLITTCSGGRNHRCAKMSIEEGKPIEEIEARELNGQKLQGTTTAEEVHRFLSSQGMKKDFPLFTAVYDILQGKVNPQDLPGLVEPSSEDLPNSGRHHEREQDRKPQLEPEPSNPSPPPPPVDSLAASAMQPESSPQHISSTKLLSDLATTNKPPPSSSHLKRKRTPVQHPSFIPAHPLSTSRYTRQLILPQISLAGQRSLSQSRILIIGLGGLGCPASLYLAAAGLGTLGLLDSDTVELSNLHRQVLHRENSVGWTKARSAIRGLREINSKISYRAYEEPFLPSNAIRIASQYDLLLDCTDNPQTRYLINDVAVALSKTVVSAAAQRMEGQCMILNSPVDKGPCYRCIFPRPPKAEMVVSCEEVGVLGPAVGTMGVIMASEAIRVIVQQQQQQQESSPTTIKEPERKPAMLLYNAWAETMFRTIRLRNKRLDCISCGNPSHLKEGEEKITAEAIQNGGVDYVTFCGTREEVMILKDEERIDAKSFLCDILDHHDEEQEQETNPKPTTPNPLIIDVRESHEYALGPKIKSSINIPISTILRTTSSSSSSFSFSSSSASTNPELRSLLLSHLNPESHTQLQSLIFLCPRGNDSQIAARKFSEELRHVFDPTTTTTTTSIPVAVDDDNDVDDGNGNGIPDKGLFIGDVKGGWEALLKEDLLGGGGAGKGALGS